MDKQPYNIIDYAIWIQTPLQSTKDVYIHIAKDVETKFKSSIYKFNDHYLKGKNKKIIGLIMAGLATLRPKTCSI